MMDYTQKMNNNLHSYSAPDSGHGREYMYSLLDMVKAHNEAARPALVREMFLFDKIYDGDAVINSLSDFRFCPVNLSKAFTDSSFEEIELLLKEIDDVELAELLGKNLKGLKKSAKDTSGEYINSDAESNERIIIEELYSYKYGEAFRLLRRSVSPEDAERLIKGYLNAPSKEKVDDIIHAIDLKYCCVDKVNAALSDEHFDADFVNGIIESGDSHIDMGKQIIRSIYDKQTDYPSSKDYIRRVVLECMDKELDSKDSIRLIIVKQFLKNGYKDKYLAEYDFKDLTDDILDSVKEGIKETYKDNKSKCKDALKEYNKASVVALADDISKGIIKSNNVTREKLFKFAIAFNMRCSYTEDEASELGVRDVNNSLFGDYYSYLFVKEALDRSNNRGKIEQEDKALDYGSIAAAVNFKNPIDCIYVFYLNNDTIPVSDKWDKIRKMISKINTGTNDTCLDTNNINDTIVYKDEMMDLGKNEDMFRDYIMNFNIYSFIGKGYNINYQMISGRQCYEQIFDEMIYDNNDNRNFKKQLEHISKLGIGINESEIYKLCDSSDQFSLFIEEFKDMMLRIPLDTETTILYSALNNFGDRIDVSEEEIAEAEKRSGISRYDIIRLLYYKFLLEGNAEGLPFDYLFVMFERYVNEYILDTRFHPFNSKNIFDVLVVLALFNNSEKGTVL